MTFFYNESLRIYALSLQHEFYSTFFYNEYELKLIFFYRNLQNFSNLSTDCFCKVTKQSVFRTTRLYQIV